MLDTLLLNLAYVALLGSTFTRTALQLRLMILVGSFFFITFGVLVGIPSMVIWNAVIATLHLVNIARIVRRQRTTTVSVEAEWMRQVVFADMEPTAFNRMWAASWVGEYDGHTLTKQGESHGRLAILMSGVIDVWIDGAIVNRLGPGAMIGEMSLMSGSVATATTSAAGHAVVQEWERAELALLGADDPLIGRAVEQAALRSMVYKMQMIGTTAAGQ